MVRVKRGEGGTRPAIFSLNDLLAGTLDRAIRRVKVKKWDYVSIVAGLPGAGKSTFAQMCAKYVCDWFDESYIAFSGEEFIRITTECPEFSSVVLDESFESLNSKISMSPEFIKIVNHLQIIRQKRLFIFICLPNFFDLSKGIAVFRSSNLFVTYGNEDDDKGYFLTFGRDEKRKLFVKGSKFMDYNAERANFNGVFGVPHIIPESIYEEMKRNHMISQNRGKEKITRDKAVRDKLIVYLKVVEKWTAIKICEVSGLPITTVYNILEMYGHMKPKTESQIDKILATIPRNLPIPTQ